ncbi:hypothetical protein FNF29_01659 [Cafeteria roenbergensis]|uniref:Nucleotide-diphospho-sugar transferase domain-containing protein n=2 Tax=Cafeteria roenbergensis TaxID=33653 RepID=A0A5A8C707_CAFRO|nr:hypothetical protein FNF31_07393 [Cafeteria roenbergensis]KAA0155744.1 hypothetical protein FNF29_01659 [Cafeteria roenbergensis]|eukprot:KAA0155744.1 hypothetical protein FNF29_01659 [Cafeteria roenbergensis]
MPGFLKPCAPAQRDSKRYLAVAAMAAVAVTITFATMAWLPPSDGSLSGAFDSLNGDGVGNYGVQPKLSQPRLFDHESEQTVVRTKRTRATWSVLRGKAAEKGLEPSDSRLNLQAGSQVAGSEPTATPTTGPSSEPDATSPDVPPEIPGSKPKLPRPAPVTPLSGSPSTATPLLQDSAFVAAVHKAGAATAGEVGAALAKGGRPPLVIGIGDRGFLPMLQNFIATSIQRHAIRHYLVVALEQGMCRTIPTLGGAVTCVDAPGDYGAGGEYGSVEFARIVNVKSEVVMAIVRLGYDVLLVDGDIVFLQNPLPVLARNNKGRVYDLQIQDDAEAGRNSGFMFVKATPGGLAFIAKAVEIARKDPEIRQQPAVNMAMRRMKLSFSHLVLPTSSFPCGKAFFESPRRMFAHENPCRKCVIMHNNWIVGTVAKVHRFKESLQWLVDGPNAYYSSPSRKYLEFGNPSASASLDTELGALRAAMAIGRMLGRTVILPAFRCHGCSVFGLGGTKRGCSGTSRDPDTCSFTAHFGIREFLASMGQDSFRERMFRYNPLTPAEPPAGDYHAVRLAFDAAADGESALAPSPEAQWVISTTAKLPSMSNDDAPMTQDVQPADLDNGPTEEEILDWFGSNGSPVLRFKHLYGISARFSDSEKQAEFDKAWAAAITENTVRQY